MTEAHKRFQEAFDEFFSLSLNHKSDFLEALLFHFTITGRAIWSDEPSSDLEKVTALKWLNELTHKVWALKYELREGVDCDSMSRLYELMKFYGEQSDLLRKQLVPTTLLAYDLFKKMT